MPRKNFTYVKTQNKINSDVRAVVSQLLNVCKKINMPIVNAEQIRCWWQPRLGRPSLNELRTYLTEAKEKGYLQKIKGGYTATDKGKLLLDKGQTFFAQ